MKFVKKIIIVLSLSSIACASFAASKLIQKAGNTTNANVEVSSNNDIAYLQKQAVESADRAAITVAGGGHFLNHVNGDNTYIDAGEKALSDSAQ